MSETFEVDPLQEFIDSIRNKETRKKYEKRLALFLDKIGIEGADLKEKARAFAKKAKLDPDWATFQINQYMGQHKLRAERKEISESTLPNYFKPIKLFCEENNITLNWKKISRRIPKGRKHADDRAPKVKEIKQILNYPDRRIKPAVLLMISCGGRVGMFDFLNWGHISPIERKEQLVAAKIKIYAGTNEEYDSFITPEAYRAVQEYIAFRSESGERITKDSPVLRDLFFPDHLGRGQPHIPKRFRPDLVRHLLGDALFPIRGKLKPGKKRHEFQADHGFTKFFNTACDRHMRTLYVEFLMGHNTGLKESYNRAQEDELLNEYLKAVPDLTILEQVSQTEVVNDIESMKKKMSEMELREEKRAEFIFETVKSLQETLVTFSKWPPAARKGNESDRLALEEMKGKFKQQNDEFVKSFMKAP
jgi:hypothetical protein